MALILVATCLFEACTSLLVVLSGDRSWRLVLAESRIQTELGTLVPESLWLGRLVHQPDVAVRVYRPLGPLRVRDRLGRSDWYVPSFYGTETA